MNMDIINNDEVLYCCNHPDRQTTIRCMKCNRPVCLECAVSTPKGYICKDCLEKQKRRFASNENQELLLACLIPGSFGLIGSLILSKIPVSGLVCLIMGPLLGIAASKIVNSLTNDRKSSSINQVMILSAGIGGALPLLKAVFIILRSIFLGNIGKLIKSGNLIASQNILFIILLCVTIWGIQKGIRLDNWFKKMKK